MPDHVIFGLLLFAEREECKLERVRNVRHVCMSVYLHTHIAFDC